MLTLYTNGMFEEVVSPKGANLVLYKWVFTVKITLSGTLDRFKVRLIARGFSQVYGQNYD